MTEEHGGFIERMKRVKIDQGLGDLTRKEIDDAIDGLKYFKGYSRVGIRLCSPSEMAGYKAVAAASGCHVDNALLMAFMHKEYADIYLKAKKEDEERRWRKKDEEV